MCVCKRNSCTCLSSQQLHLTLSTLQTVTIEPSVAVLQTAQGSARRYYESASKQSGHPRIAPGTVGGVHVRSNMPKVWWVVSSCVRSLHLAHVELEAVSAAPVAPTGMPETTKSGTNDCYGT